ncbi:MAG: hypothetical protein ACNS60_03020 [Candidatus Cyclobacteriaceae bacterium M2_1C_046]
MKKLLALLFMAGSILTISSCSDDDEIIDLEAPVLTAPSPAAVQVGETTSLTFQLIAEAGFVEASLSAVTGGTANITSQPAAGDESGNIIVEFTAGAEAGAGSFIVTVTDEEGDSDDATGVINISASAVPKITGIPASASVQAGEQLGPVTATIDMDDVPGTLTINKNGVQFDIIDVTADDQAIDFSYTPTREESSSTIEFDFVAEDADGDIATITHILTVTAPAIPVKVIDSNITANTTFDSDTIYELATRVAVVNGITLTIEAGTVIKGQSGTGSNATALLIARGAKLMAQGTADAPIIFTSASDDIIPGQIVSPNIDPSVDGLWGGLLILGNAPISADAVSVQIEGIPATDPNGLYGGTDPADNSGVIQYVSVRHGGANIGEGNEINGITLGGVGTGTIIDHIEVVGNQDDGIEWFGGTVNVTSALVWNAGDDAIDADQAYAGTLNNFVVVNPGDEAFELDGPEGALANENYVIKNGTVYLGGASGIIDFDANTDVTMSNILFFGLSSGQDVEEYAALTVGEITGGFEAILPSGTVVGDFFTGIEDTKVTAIDALGNATVGADISAFNWTFAAKSGALSEIGL